MSLTPDAPTPPPTPDQPQESAQPVETAQPVEAAPRPPENVLRGTLLALLTLPAGVAVWAIVSAFGFISGWITLLISVAALALYRKGSGGRFSFAGAFRTAAIALGTIVISVLVGPVIAQPGYFARAVERGRFLEGIGAWYSGADGALPALLVVGFTIVGIVLIFRTAAQERKAD